MLTHPKRDDPPVDQTARERRFGEDLDAVGVAQEPLEVDEDARAYGGDLLEAGEVEECHPRAEAGVLDESLRCPRADRAQQQGWSFGREPVTEEEAGTQLDRAPLSPPAERQPAGGMVDDVDVLEFIAAVRGKAVEDLALRQGQRRPLDLPASANRVELGLVYLRLQGGLVPPRLLGLELVGPCCDARVDDRLGGGRVHAASSTTPSTTSAASRASGKRVPPLACASASAQPPSGSATSATTQPIRARRRARPSARTSATGSPPGRIGTVGNPSLTTTTSGTALGCLSSSARRSRRARRSASPRGVCPLSGISSRRRRAREQLAVGGSATVASGTPPLNATSATLSPRRVASCKSSKTRPFTFSTMRSACTDQLLSTTKHTQNGERCSRTFRRRSSGRTSRGAPAERSAAARKVASKATSKSPGSASLCRVYLPRLRPTNERARRPSRARSSRSRRRCREKSCAGSARRLSMPGEPSGAASASRPTSPGPRLFLASPRLRAPRRAGGAEREARPGGRERRGRRRGGDRARGRLLPARPQRPLHP